METLGAILLAVLMLAKEYFSGVRRKAAEAEMAWKLAEQRGALNDQLKAKLAAKEAQLRLLEAQLVEHLSTDDIATELNKLHSH